LNFYFLLVYLFTNTDAERLFAEKSLGSFSLFLSKKLQ